ncbi:hypothetical protein OE88DRAFT_1625265 [Heliocybe sulcata]|uniref:Uncharacterized protein n=1 Tax=Heliocybe sulcata TaxID=5364 RepID=A0A5C3NAJ6_9AGAM|nr:hypothetical protein OE88DRAFT_1625265 [Heliocybe sulcata]
MSFPLDSRGFFYWHLESDAPPILGQVRFRTTRSPDPATFSTGRDLQLPNGRVWHISLFEIARRPRYSCLRAQLLSEDLVTEQMLDTALQISASYGAGLHHPGAGSLLIWKFGQRFLVNLPNMGVSLWVIGSSAVERLLLPSLSSVCVRESGSSEACYVLSERQALVQFERSTLPEHKGTRTVVLRILKVITKSEGSDDASWMPEPQDDSLDMTEIHEHCWSWNVDQPSRGVPLGASAKALRILFDNAALQEREDGRGAES